MLISTVFISFASYCIAGGGGGVGIDFLALWVEGQLLNER